MVVSRWQTVEDGKPRDEVDRLLRHEGHVTEHVFIAVPVRLSPSRQPMRVHLVIRACQHTGEVTAAWERYESGDDGA